VTEPWHADDAEELDRQLAMSGAGEVHGA
jgi:hypothetical protein